MRNEGCCCSDRSLASKKAFANGLYLIFSDVIYNSDGSGELKFDV